MDGEGRVEENGKRLVMVSPSISISWVLMYLESTQQPGQFLQPSSRLEGFRGAELRSPGFGVRRPGSRFAAAGT